MASLDNDVKCCNKPSRSHTTLNPLTTESHDSIKTTVEEKGEKSARSGTRRQDSEMTYTEDDTVDVLSHPTMKVPYNLTYAPRANKCLYQLSQVESDFFSLFNNCIILTNSSCDGKPLFTLKIPKRLERCRFDPFPGAKRPTAIESTCFHSRNPEPRCTMSSSDEALFSAFNWHVPSLHRYHV